MRTSFAFAVRAAARSPSCRRSFFPAGSEAPSRQHRHPRHRWQRQGAGAGGSPCCWGSPPQSCSCLPCCPAESGAASAILDRHGTFLRPGIALRGWHGYDSAMQIPGRVLVLLRLGAASSADGGRAPSANGTVAAAESAFLDYLDAVGAVGFIESGGAKSFDGQDLVAWKRGSKRAQAFRPGVVAYRARQTRRCRPGRRRGDAQIGGGHWRPTTPRRVRRSAPAPMPSAATSTTPRCGQLWSAATSSTAIACSTTAARSIAAPHCNCCTSSTTAHNARPSSQPSRRSGRRSMAAAKPTARIGA